jgi:hypothetical protein
MPVCGDIEGERESYREGKRQQVQVETEEMRRSRGEGIIKDLLQYDKYLDHER